MKNVWKLWKKYGKNTTPGDIMLNRDFKEFIESLNKHNVRYLLVGGYAVAFHGYPRYTKDLDIWIELSPDNADNAVKALEEFGFESVGLKKEDFLEKNQVIQLGYPPNRIDLLTTLKEITFRDCYKKRVEIRIQGVKVNFIDLENLKRNKRATGRTQDLADAENLE
ncbi:MAG: hypothetical protein ACLFSY_09540 [Desulfonatronovibrionaceae bacterium]